MRKTIIKILVTVIGYTLLVLGVIGLFLPVLQGILMILAGLTLLSTEYHWPSRIIKKFRKHFQKAKAIKMKKEKEKRIKAEINTGSGQTLKTDRRIKTGVK